MKCMTEQDLHRAALLTVGQIAKILKRTRPAIRRVLRAGGVNVLRVGNRYAIERLTLAEKMPGVYSAIERAVIDEELERHGLADLRSYEHL